MGLVLLSLIAGVLLARGGMPAGAPATLNAWVLRVALPAVVLLRIPTMTLDTTLWLPALAPWAVLVGAAALVAAVGVARGWSRRRMGCLVLTAGLGNTSFAGLPLVAAVLGPEAVGPALVADQLGSFLALSTAGLAIAAAASGDTLGARAVVERVTRFPPFLALVAALGVRALGGWPAAAVAPLEGLAATLTPVALCSVGLQLRLGAARALVAPLALGLGWKLVVAPAAVFAAVAGIDGLPAQVAVLQAGMAPMVTGGVLAQERGLEPELAATMVGVGLLLSLGTVPLWGWAMG